MAAAGVRLVVHLRWTPRIHWRQLAENLPAVVEKLNRAKEGGLFGDLGRVADEDDLGVGGIEMAARRSEDIVGSEGVNLLSIGFEVITGQFIEIDGRELTEQTALRGNAERKHSR